MKLIIDIPEDLYKGIECRNPELETEYVCDELMKAVDNSIPLDDVKAEMQKVRRFHVGNFEDDNPIDYGIVEGFDKAVEILDNIGKAESEDKE